MTAGRTRRGIVFSLLALLIAALIIVFLFSRQLNSYFRKSVSPDAAVQNAVAENPVSAAGIKTENYDGVLSSVRTQLANATQKEFSRLEDIQQSQEPK